MVTSTALSTAVEAEARGTRIKAGLTQMDKLAEDIAPLLAQAKEHEDWKALGYDTWEAYTTGYLGITRRRSYQLLDQVRVNTVLTAAAGRPVALPEGQTREIKRSPRLKAAVVEGVRAGVEPSVAYQRAIAEQRASERVFAVDSKVGKKHRGYEGPTEKVRGWIETFESWLNLRDADEPLDREFERALERLDSVLHEFIPLQVDLETGEVPMTRGKSLDALIQSGMVSRGIQREPFEGD